MESNGRKSKIRNCITGGGGGGILLSLLDFLAQTLVITISVFRRRSFADAPGGFEQAALPAPAFRPAAGFVVRAEGPNRTSDNRQVREPA